MISYDFEFRGLSICVELSDFIPGDRENPPAGHELIEMEFFVGNPETLRDELSADGHLFDSFEYEVDELVPPVVREIISSWKLDFHALEYFYHDLGGNAEEG